MIGAKGEANPVFGLVLLLFIWVVVIGGNHKPRRC